MEHVHSQADHRQRRLTPGRRVVKGVQVGDSGLHLGVDPLGPADPALIPPFDRRELDSPDEAQLARPGHAPGHHPGEEGALLDAEHQRGDLSLDPLARGDDERRLGVGSAHPLRRALELEAVAEDQVVSLRGVGTKRLFLLGRGPRLEVADLDA